SPAAITLAIPSRGLVKGRMTKLVIQPPFLLITQHRVRLGDLFEHFLRMAVPLVAVRMILFRQFSVCFLDGVLAVVPVDAQNLIIISLRFQTSHLPTFLSAQTSLQRFLLCRILRLRRVAQATSSFPPQYPRFAGGRPCDPRGAFFI